MKKLFAGLIVLALSGCAITGDVFGPTPEAQVVNGANLGRAATATGRLTLRHNKITPAQARTYDNLLSAANAQMHEANTRLIACRKATGSSPQSNPDPCRASVADDLRLGLGVINDVQKTLDAK